MSDYSEPRPRLNERERVSDVFDASMEVEPSAFDDSHPSRMRSQSGGAGGVPVYVMLPLDTVSREGELCAMEQLALRLEALRDVGVEGVMIDVWWGIVERRAPGVYDWAPYIALANVLERLELKLHVVLSFHACGANRDDDYHVPLPPWVEDAVGRDPDGLLFQDKEGTRSDEYLSLWADDAQMPVFAAAGAADGARDFAGRSGTGEGLFPRTRDPSATPPGRDDGPGYQYPPRSPLECYRDLMRAFRATFDDRLRPGGLVTEVLVGCGPCGELRFPAYAMSRGWRFPGIGEFQCYDQRALGNLARAGSEAGHIEWGGAGPHDAGGYNNLPHETGFFRAHEGSWDSEYGQFFLSWYAGELVEHGDRMLRCARSVFSRDDERDDGREREKRTGKSSASARAAAKGAAEPAPAPRGPALAIKCAGVHWWYNSRSHAAELTAGYFNTRSGDRAPERDGYEPIVAICGKHGARLNFTCAEMRDVEHPFFSRCGPEGLLRQIRAAAARYGVKVAGENALCRFDQDAYDKIITNCRGEGDDAELWSAGTLLPPMASFTFLRLSKELFEDDNFSSFVRFVARMANETGTEVVEAEDVVEAEEVLSSLFSAEADLLPGGLRDIRDETSSGFVAAQFSDL